jgi:hypothetical protein
VRSLGPGYDRGGARDAPVFVKEEFARTGPKANVLKAISNAACKPQAKDSDMTVQAIVRRNATAPDQAALSSP